MLGKIYIRDSEWKNIIYIDFHIIFVRYIIFVVAVE